jgi:hypothetical protein
MRRSVKRVMVVLGLGLLLPIGLAGQSLATKPVGGCPTDRWVLRDAPASIPSADFNGDGRSCFLEAPVGSGIFTVIDNVIHRP